MTPLIAPSRRCPARFCPRCRYSRRGLPLNSRCPECGFDVIDDVPMFIYERRTLIVAISIGWIVACAPFVVIRPSATGLGVILGSYSVLWGVTCCLASRFIGERVWAFSMTGIVYIRNGRIRRVIHWHHCSAIQLGRWATWAVRIREHAGGSSWIALGRRRLAREFCSVASNLRRQFAGSALSGNA